MTEENNRTERKKLNFSYRVQFTSSKNLSSFGHKSVNFLFRKLGKRNKTKIEKKEKIDKEQVEEELIKMKRISRHKSLYELCINALIYQVNERTIELNKTISFYLRTLKNFMNILSNETEDELEHTLYDISSHLHYEKYEKNNIICKYGERADKFYIILKGKVIFLVPKMNKHYLSEEEYLEYLLKLRKQGEVELVNNIINKNELIFYYGEDFDEYILNVIDKHEKNKENIYSKKIYDLFYEFKKFKANEHKNKKENETINIDEYIQMTILKTNDNPEYAKLKKKKLISVYEYEKTNIFEDGDSFGAVGANSKTNKRTATSVAYDNCHLGILSKDDYLNILEKVNSKARDKLYELVVANKIFTKMSKYTFSNKYMHMFHYKKYFKNNFIMSDTDIFDSIIILYQGEYTLSINKNIIELNELILRVKKIKAKMMNINEDIMKKDLKELKENELLLMNMRFSPKEVCDLIKKKQYYIISKVTDGLVLGYPNTVDPETNLPLFNCECSSTIAYGYKIESDMIKLIRKDNYIRKNPPEIAILYLNRFLERLLDLKETIMGRINNKQKYKLNENNINDINIELENENFKNNNITSEDKKNEINRNSMPKKIKTTSVLFDFNKEQINTDFGKTVKRKKPKTLSPLNRKLKNNLTNSNSNDNTSIKNFFTLINKFKKNVIEKNALLRAVQKQSHRFLTKEKIEMKKIQMNLNKLKSKEEYNDFSTIFAKNPHVKKTILDKFKNIKERDNVLDPLLYNIKKNVKNNKTFTSNLIQNDNNKETDNITNESIYKLFNTFLNNTNNKNNTYNTNYTDFNSDNKTNDRKQKGKNTLNTTEFNNKNIKLNNLKNKKKLSMSYNNKNFSSMYKNTDYNSTNKRSTDYSNTYNLTTINLNDNINITQKSDNYINTTDNNQDLYYMLYLQYIFEELNNKKEYKNSLSLSKNKFKTLSYENSYINRFNNHKNKELLIPYIGKKNKNKNIENVLISENNISKNK